MCILLILEYLIIGYIIIFSWLLWSTRNQPENLEDSGRAVAIAFAIPLWLPILLAAICFMFWKSLKKIWKWLCS